MANKKNHISLSTDESIHSVVSVKTAYEFSHCCDLDEKKKKKKKKKKKTKTNNTYTKEM